MRRRGRRNGWLSEWPACVGLTVAGVLVVASMSLTPTGAADEREESTEGIAHSAEELARYPSADARRASDNWLADERPKEKKEKTAEPRKQREEPTTKRVVTGRLVRVNGTSGAIRTDGVRFQFSAPTHAPVVGRPWTVTVDARRKGKPVAGTVSLDILYRNLVVAHAHSGKLAKGRYRHTIKWPKRGLGHPLTLQAKVETGGRIQLFLYPFKVRASS